MCLRCFFNVCYMFLFFLSLVSLSLWPFYLRFISRLSTFICKGPGSEYIGWVSHSVSITAIQLCTCSREVARDINKWMWLSSNGTLLWPLKFEFHLIFMCHEISLLVLVFFNCLKNVEIILSLQSYRSTMVDWIWLWGLHLQTSPLIS